jgi:two-component system nitrate/nitrite sensor histidine kinase NarX
MQVRWSLTAKLVATGLSFLLLALASIGLTLWVTWSLEGSAAAVNEAGRMRMQTYRLALAANGGAGPAQLADLSRQFDQSIGLLQTGDPSRPLVVPWTAGTREQFEQLKARWPQLRAAWEPGSGVAPATARQADDFVALVDGFVGGIEAEIARWTAILNLFQLAMMALAIASAVTLMYTSYLLVLSPVARLKRAVVAIQQGDLATRVEAGAQDEFGELAAGFNEMAGTLQTLYASLEEKVREKTASLEVERQRLADLYQVSAFLSKARSLDALATGFASQVRRIAGADAAAVRWSGQANERYLLLAADGLSDDMRRNEACLETGACHCGQPQARAATRVIPIDRAAPEPPLHHCRRAGYETLVSVPVMLHDSALGEVDLFFRRPVQLSPEERSLLDSLAAHLASAMESLRAEALGREAAVAQERGMLARELHDSIAQSLAFMKIQVQLLRDAVRREDRGAVGNIIGELDTGVRESYSDVRELLLHFRTRTSEEDIAPALRSTLSKFEHQSGVPARLEMAGHGLPLAPDVQVQVLHVIQEALSNVRKHARASQVVLRVTAAPDWCFEVRDDGVGFDPQARGAGELHVGLRIMSERAARIGASVQVLSRSGGGCAVAIKLPQLAQQPAAELPQAQAA